MYFVAWSSKCFCKKAQEFEDQKLVETSVLFNWSASSCAMCPFQNELTSAEEKDEWRRIDRTRRMVGCTHSLERLPNQHQSFLDLKMPTLRKAMLKKRWEFEILAITLLGSQTSKRVDLNPSKSSTSSFLAQPRRVTGRPAERPIKPIAWCVYVGTKGFLKLLRQPQCRCLLLATRVSNRTRWIEVENEQNELIDGTMHERPCQIATNFTFQGLSAWKETIWGTQLQNHNILMHSTVGRCTESFFLIQSSKVTPPKRLYTHIYLYLYIVVNNQQRAVWSGQIEVSLHNCFSFGIFSPGQWWRPCAVRLNERHQTISISKPSHLQSTAALISTHITLDATFTLA